MTTRSALLVSAAALGCACAPAIPLSGRDATQLASVPEIAVAYKKSPAPWVYCPGDIGRETWEHGGGSMNWTPDESTGLALQRGVTGYVVLASLEDAARFRAAGDIWQDIQDDWTKSLQVPPDDPARATARDFLALAGRTGPRLPFQGEAVEVVKGSPQTLSERFGSTPVLVFRTSEWLLVGCFFTYSPWFNVQAALVDPGSGRVLWRDTCDGGFPKTWDQSPSSLDANGRALYVRIIDDRADQCSRELFASFERGFTDQGAAQK